MHCYGRITGTDPGLKGTWLVELDANGVPTHEYSLIPAEVMPDVAPVWSIQLQMRDGEFAFAGDEAGRISMMKMMHRRMERLQGLDARS